MAKSQLLVVQAKTVQDCGVQIVNVNSILDDVKAEVIRFADDLTSLNASAAHP